ncbi:MAG: protein kinase domain-containing protein, partial [Acidobacteriota bacterium]
MRLSPGARLGDYEILSFIGAGGMGEVYRARDLKLDREVAVKVLTASLARDPEMLARFEREAKSLASLSHPNILGVFDFGEGGPAGRDAFVVTELLEGETLRDKITQANNDSSHGRRLPLTKALEWAAGVAQGLSAAHAKGLVHRDLKPENVFVTASGVAKILDFGLARLATHDVGGPTRTPISSAGMVVGSAAYMSPEQAQGESVDHRSDIFSFGSLLYELISGQHPFRSGSPLQTMQRVIEADPAPIESLVPDVPLELQWIVTKALAKDPGERYQSSADMVVDLQRLRKQMDSGVTTPPRGYSGRTTAAVGQSAAKRRWTILATGGVIALAVVVAAWYGWSAYTRRGTPIGPVVIRPLTSNGLVIDACISPDAKYLAYVESFEGKHALWLKQIGTGSLIQLMPPAPVGYWGISFAPDGSSIYYAMKAASLPGGALFRLPTLGGTPRTLLSGIDSAVSFSRDGTRISYLRADYPRPGESAVMVAQADGSGTRVLASRQSPDAFAPGFFVTTTWSQDGRLVFAPLRHARLLSWEVVALDSTDGHVVPYSFPRDSFLQIGGLHALPDNGLLFVGSVRTGASSQLGSGNEQVWLLPEGSSNPRPITNDLSGYRAVHATEDGRALTVVSASATATLWELRSDGTDIRRIVSSRLDGLAGLSVTPGGRLLFRSSEGGRADVWTMAADGTDRHPLTDAGLNASPVASPDGRTIVYLSSQGGTVDVWRMDPDGSNQRQIEHIGATNAPAISPDSKWVIFQSPSGGTQTLWRVPIEGGTPVQLSKTPAIRPSISPDGQFVAALNTSGTPTSILILPTAGGDPVKVLPAPEQSSISIVKWSPEGRSLIHTAGGGRQTLYVQALDGSPARPLVHYAEEQIFGFDVTSDGRIFLSRGILSRDAM